MGKTKRSQMLSYINVTPDSSTEKWALLGMGITGASIDYNAQTEETQYIHQDTGSTSVTGYRPTFPVNSQMIATDDALKYVDGLRLQRAILADAETEIINVYTYMDGSGGGFVAERQPVSLQFDSFGGDGGDSLNFDFTINYIGDHTVGVWDAAEKEFTGKTTYAGTGTSSGLTNVSQVSAKAVKE